MTQIVRLITDPPSAGSWNMAVDQAILESANETGSVTLRFYQWTPATVSLGYFQSLESRDAHEPSAECPIVRRATGGGAIVHDRELTYSLCVPSRSRWADENQTLYTKMHSALIACLSTFNVTATLVEQPAEFAVEPFLCFERRAVGDVVCQNYKICGSAQRRIDKSILQHGSILLAKSESAPELPGINDLENKSISIDELQQQLLTQIRQSFDFEFEFGELSSSENAKVGEIQRNRFQSEAWTAKR